MLLRFPGFLNDSQKGSFDDTMTLCHTHTLPHADSRLGLVIAIAAALSPGRAACNVGVAATLRLYDDGGNLRMVSSMKSQKGLVDIFRIDLAIRKHPSIHEYSDAIVGIGMLVEPSEEWVGGKDSLIELKISKCPFHVF